MAAILSTKILQSNQRELILNAGLSFIEYDAIEIKWVDVTLLRNRAREIHDREEKSRAIKQENIIITSQNAVRSIENSKLDIQDSKVYCVGEKTRNLLEDKGVDVVYTAINAAQLGEYIVHNHPIKEFIYLCGNMRRDELPELLKLGGIVCEEIVVYETQLTKKTFDRAFDGLLFFSPSGVTSFIEANPNVNVRTEKNTAFCIGKTTANEAEKYFNTVIVSNSTTVESTIAKAVNTLKKMSI